ncbi:hypothetical protein J7K06_06700 [Candidatus Bathyarchaeota archaeon]|nr:hypothetical protein [Candidatus Bathyarchaeota archaeon]
MDEALTKIEEYVAMLKTLYTETGIIPTELANAVRAQLERMPSKAIIYFYQLLCRQNDLLQAFVSSSIHMD